MPEKVKIYLTTYCPYCHWAKALLKRKKVAFDEIDVTENPDLRGELEKKTGWMTVPMIFIGDEFIGGYDELNGLDKEGKLDQKLAG